jgi:hypothetical protein
MGRENLKYRKSILAARGKISPDKPFLAYRWPIQKNPPVDQRAGLVRVISNAFISKVVIL